MGDKKVQEMEAFILLYFHSELYGKVEIFKGVKEVFQLPDTASPEANNIVDVAVPECYSSGHGANVKDAGFKVIKENFGEKIIYPSYML